MYGADIYLTNGYYRRVTDKPCSTYRVNILDDGIPVISLLSNDSAYNDILCCHACRECIFLLHFQVTLASFLASQQPR